MTKTKIAILASGKGTDMKKIIEEIELGKLDAEIKIVISNKEESLALEKARKHNIKAVFLDNKGLERDDYDKKIIKELEGREIDLILLIGWSRILGTEFCEKYKYKIMNIHPSLLPAFAGGFDKNVHKQVLETGVKITGCTLHFVTQDVDSGPIILQRSVEVKQDDTPETLKVRVQEAEQAVLVEAIRLYAENRLKIENGEVSIEEEY